MTCGCGMCMSVCEFVHTDHKSHYVCNKDTLIILGGTNVSHNIVCYYSNQIDARTTYQLHYNLAYISSIYIVICPNSRKIVLTHL